MATWGDIINLEGQVLRDLQIDASVPTMSLFDKYKPNPGGQVRFWGTTPFAEISPRTFRWLAAIGGIGSGKSYTGAVWAVTRALLQPEARGLIAANTFGQLSRSSLITLVEVCRQFNVPLWPYADSVEENALKIANCQRCYIGEQKAFAYVLSMNSFTGKTQAARGLQARWAWLDESAFAKEQSFLTLDGRLGRGPGDMKAEGLITTSPNGFNWLYDRFGDPERDETKQKLYVMVSMPTRENIKYLGEDYVEGLESNYSEELAAQELEGTFINTVVGRVYKYFNRRFHALSGADKEIVEYQEGLPIHVSFDFNFNPSTCAMAQVKGDELHFFKEFYIADCDAFELGELIVEYLVDELGYDGELYIYGDASGKARTAASRMSCWDILMSAFKTAGFKAIRRFPEANPLITTRVDSVNALLRNNRLYVDGEDCPSIVKDLEMVSWGDDGIDKSDQALTHISDAVGYLVHTLYPIAGRRQGRMRKGKKPVAGIS